MGRGCGARIRCVHAVGGTVRPAHRGRPRIVLCSHRPRHWHSLAVTFRPHRTAPRRTRLPCRRIRPERHLRPRARPHRSEPGTEPAGGRTDQSLAAGLVIAASCAASFVIDLLFFGLSGSRSGTSGAVALAAGYACLAFYDAFSKRLPVPLMADTVQGVGWACLVWYGGVRAGGATAATLLAALFVIGFVVIVNAVHGGLRDLHNDSVQGAITAAIAFGARPVGDGVSVPPRLRGVAWALQGALALIALLSPLGVSGGFGLWTIWYLICLATTAAAILLLREGLRSVDRPAAVPQHRRRPHLGAVAATDCHDGDVRRPRPGPDLPAGHGAAHARQRRVPNCVPRPAGCADRRRIRLATATDNPNVKGSRP